MKLSILIPMYNAKDYIGNCIESLLHQDLSDDDYEILIIDDGSTDSSVALVEAYARQHKHIMLYKEPNSGAYTTRNKLLKLAKGDYIYNLDADDYIVHNCLGRLLHLAHNKDLDIIGFDTIETSNLNSYTLHKNITESDLVLSSGSKFIEQNRNHRHEIWWYLIKKEYLDALNLNFTNNEYNADVVFTSKILLRAERFAYLPYEIHRYVQTQDSLMRSKNFEITSKRIEYLHMMIINKSKLIREQDIRNLKILDNMTYRRDVFTFFNILNMIRNPFSKLYVNQKIKHLRSEDAYPITNFIKGEYNTLLYRTLLLIINREYLIYPLISIKNYFKRGK